MPMERDKHEELLNELLDTTIEMSRRTDILSQLRADYSGVQTEFEELSKNNERLLTDNNDLIVSNSKLFRQIGVVGTEKEEVIEKKEFSETVTIEQLEKQ